MKIPQLEKFKVTSFTLPAHVAKKVSDLNNKIEKETHAKIGKSFIVRVALEELLKRYDMKDIVLNHKIDWVRRQVGM